MRKENFIDLSPYFIKAYYFVEHASNQGVRESFITVHKYPWWCTYFQSVSSQTFLNGLTIF